MSDIIKIVLIIACCAVAVTAVLSGFTGTSVVVIGVMAWLLHVDRR